MDGYENGFFHGAGREPFPPFAFTVLIFFERVGPTLNHGVEHRIHRGQIVRGGGSDRKWRFEIQRGSTRRNSFGFGIHGRGGFIEDQHRSVLQKRARNGKSLPLSSR